MGKNSLIKGRALFGFAFLRSKRFFEKLLPGEPVVSRIEVFDNLDYYEWILYLTCKTKQYEVFNHSYFKHIL
jgi:hypothetical protein